MYKDVYDLIRKNKPNLAESSVQLYTKGIINLYKKVLSKLPEKIDDFFDLFFTKDGFEKTTDFLKKQNVNYRKSTIANILAIAYDNSSQSSVSKYRDDYKILMINDIQEYNNKLNEHNKTESQQKNWIEWNDVLTIYNEFAKQINSLKVWNDTNLSKITYNKIQQFVLLSMYVLIVPRRVADMEYLKFEKTDNENYIDFKHNQLIFNKYKTSKVYQEQKVDLPKQLKTILTKWYKLKKANGISTEYVFTRYDGSKFTQPDISNMLMRFFTGNKHSKGKRISVNILRHSYITHNLLPHLKQMKETAEEMGHSLNQQMLYAKVD